MKLWGGRFRKGENKLMEEFNKSFGFDCVLYKEDIEGLKNRCEEVLNDHSRAKELLPTVGGFFFGDTDYDEYYFKNVQEVYNYCLHLLNMFEDLQDDESIWFKIWY